MDARILLIGDELLAGEVADRNGPFMATWLKDQGFHLVRQVTLPDLQALIEAEVAAGLAAGELVCTFGGLGPTSDDRTSAAIAAVVDRTLVRDEAQWQRIQQIFAGVNRTPPPGNEKQASVPRGAVVLANELGTAPGYALRHGAGAVVALPGPPRENAPMVEGPFRAWADAHLPGRRRWTTRIFRTFGLPESEVGARLKPLEPELGEVLLAFQFHFPEVLVKLRVPEGHEAAAEALAARVREALTPGLYGEGETDLPAVLGQALVAHGKRIVTAESCTGGWVAKLLTDMPGSGNWFERGFVTYSNQAKREVLGVAAALLDEHGAVSEPVVAAMLEGALERSAADVGLAISGVAGPGGGSRYRPVGTVCLAWGDRAGLETRTLRLRWDRDYNRLVSAWSAMHRVLRAL